MADRLLNEVESIQTSFNLITDGFVKKYVNYLETKDRKEVDAIYDNIQTLGSEAYILENDLISKSEISYLKSNAVDDKNRELKMENGEIRDKLEKIGSKVDTAEESYSEELNSYRESFVNILLYFVLYVVAMKFFLGLGLSRKTELILLIIFLVLAIVFHIRSIWVYAIIVVVMIYFRKYLYTKAKASL